MKKNKKVLLIALVAILVIGATLGAVAVARAADQGTAQTQSTNVTSLFDKIAAIYKTNTGAAIDSAALQKAFQQAQKDLATEAQDKMWQKLIADGKVTQAQVDAYKKWLAARPELNTDAMKKWLESRPEGIPFGPGNNVPQMPRGFGGMDKMFHR